MKFRRDRSDRSDRSHSIQSKASMDEAVGPSTGSWDLHSPPGVGSYEFESPNNTSNNTLAGPTSDTTYEMQRSRALRKEQRVDLEHNLKPLPITEEGHVRRGRSSRHSRTQHSRAASVGRFLTKSGGKSSSSSRRSMSVDKRQHAPNRRSMSVDKKQQAPNMPLSSRQKRQVAETPVGVDITSISYDNYSDTSHADDKDYRALITTRPPSQDENEERKDYDKLERKGMSKMEKIRQLKAKNEIYKEEFKRVQKNRRHLKRDRESKKQQIASISKKIDTHIAETSMLKFKLLEALQQLDQTDHESRRDKSLILELSTELTDSQVELDRAMERISELADNLHSLKDSARHQDDQVKSLEKELAKQTTLLTEVRQENDTLLKGNNSKGDDEKVEKLQAENEHLHEELGSTLDRAAGMVKEREDAIADLLKDNDEMKAALQQQDNNADDQKESEEELLELREEMAECSAALEESQESNILHEEEVEAWICRGREMQMDVNRILKDVAEWKEKALEAEKEQEKLQGTAHRAEEEAASAQHRLEAAEHAHKSQVAEMGIKLRAAKMAEGAAQEEARAAVQAAQEEARVAVKTGQEAKFASPETIWSREESVTCDSSAVSVSSDSVATALSSDPASEGMDAQSQQAMLLEKATAKSKQKENTKRSKWFFGRSEPEELTKDQELEAISADQEEARVTVQAAQEAKRASPETVSSREESATCDSSDVSVSSDSVATALSSDPALEGMDAQSQQATLLEKAMAKRKQKESAKKSIWFFGKSDSEELTEDQKKIEELEATNADQAEELLNSKSELVRLRSTYNETMYVDTKKIEDLESKNETLQERTTELEMKLEAALCTHL